MKYDRNCFCNYVFDVMAEMNERNIKFQKKYYDEIYNFCGSLGINYYPEHNDRYLKQCYYNLQEKYDRGIITANEWNLIEKEFHNKIHEF